MPRKKFVKLVITVSNIDASSAAGLIPSVQHKSLAAEGIVFEGYSAFPFLTRIDVDGEQSPMA